MQETERSIPNSKWLLGSPCSLGIPILIASSLAHYFDENALRA